MNSLNLPASLRQLAAEPARETTDPWSPIREQLLRRRHAPSRGGLLRLLTLRMGALPSVVAAAIVLALGISVVLFANRPQPVSAAEVLQKVQAEAFQVSASGPGACVPTGAGQRSGQTQAAGAFFAVGSQGQSGGPPVGPATVANATEFSDKLAQALGVDGDTVRQAMRQTVSADFPSGPLPDPMASIAQQLGVSTAQVCAAFFNGQSAGVVISASSAGGRRATSGGPVEPGAVVGLNGTPIDLNTVTAEELSVQAQKLGVTPQRLLSAVKASIPSPPPTPPAPPSEDEIISRFAQNLGIGEDRVRAAITKVEGQTPFYFAVPLPGFGKS